jgi:hypothetical protein
MVMEHNFRDSIRDEMSPAPVHFLDPLRRVKLEFVQLDLSGEGSDASDATEASSEDDSGSTVFQERVAMVRVKDVFISLIFADALVIASSIIPPDPVVVVTSSVFALHPELIMMVG